MLCVLCALCVVFHVCCGSCVLSVLCVVLQNGEKNQSLEEFALPEGWSWEDKWGADLNRAVDEQGNLPGTVCQKGFGLNETGKKQE